MKTKPSKEPLEKAGKKITLFDHVNQIKLTKNKDYFKSLSDDDKKSFNTFLILRALSMNEDIIEDISDLYKYVNIIPQEQFYRLLITIVPRDQFFHKWIKSKSFKHSPALLKIISNTFLVSSEQANEYANLLIKTESGLQELISICKEQGYNDSDIEKILNSSVEKEYLHQPKQ